MFKLLKKSTKSGARRGQIKTPHGGVKTPFFMPDATRGFIKSLANGELDKINTGPMVVNTYHLYLQPKMEIIKKAGGIHRFMDWGKPLLSDSGGFQIFSLVHKNPKMGKLTDEGVEFKSPLDGSVHKLTPEESIKIQFELGVDMMVCLDDCPPNDFRRDALEMSVARTIYWAKRCRQEYDRQIKKRKIKKTERPLLFSVIQGGAYSDLRKKCFDGLREVGPDLGWDGYGFGGRPVDEQGKFLGKVLKFTADLIPKNSLRFALGVGAPEDIARCVSYGWDMFDCVIPTREGRHGRLFYYRHPGAAGSKSRSVSIKRDCPAYKTVNIHNAKFKKDFSPINPDSRLEELRGYSKAYLHHLFKLKEPLGQRLAALNNLEFYLNLMEDIRKNI